MLLFLMKMYVTVLSAVYVVFLVLNHTLIKNMGNANFSSLFECGFDPVFWEMNKMSLHFFKIGIIFILFDLEIMFMVFMIKKMPDFYLVAGIHLFILLTFFLEILNKVLKWSL